MDGRLEHDPRVLLNHATVVHVLNVTAIGSDETGTCNVAIAQLQREKASHAPTMPTRNQSMASTLPLLYLAAAATFAGNFQRVLTSSASTPDDTSNPGGV